MSIIEEAIICTVLITFLATAVTWISFARISMTRIERKMKADGLPRPCPWDGVGARALWIAWVIAIPVGSFNLVNDPSIDVLTVRKYANAMDKKIAIAFMISTYSGLFVGLLGAALGYY